jgi:hypothetical protein
MKRYSVTVNGTDFDMPTYQAAKRRFNRELKAGKAVCLWDWKAGERGVRLGDFDAGKLLRAPK